MQILKRRGLDGYLAPESSLWLSVVHCRKPRVYPFRRLQAASSPRCHTTRLCGGAAHAIQQAVRYQPSELFGRQRKGEKSAFVEFGPCFANETSTSGNVTCQINCFGCSRMLSVTRNSPGKNLLFLQSGKYLLRRKM